MAYTKKAFNDIFEFCSNDSDFTELYLDYYKTIHPEQDLIARSAKRAESVGELAIWRLGNTPQKRRLLSC